MSSIKWDLNGDDDDGDNGSFVSDFASQETPQLWFESSKIRLNRLWMIKDTLLF